MAKSKQRKNHKQKVQQFKQKQNRRKNVVNNHFQTLLSKEMEKRAEENQEQEKNG
jgi:hypothetical protein